MYSQRYGFLGLIILLLANVTFALPSESRFDPINQGLSWSVTASIGYSNFENMYANEGNVILGRLAFDKKLLNFKQMDIGTELGVQNGSSMLLNVSQEDLDLLGGSPVQTVVKPIIDLLATVTTPTLMNTPIFGEIKGGIAYRSWQFEDRTSINPVSNIAGELQAGLGVSITQNTKLILLYQGIYGGNSNFLIDGTNEEAHVSTIPIQNGVLLSFNILV